MRIHVVSFSPVPDEASVGGFEWRYDLDAALAEMREQLAAPEVRSYNLALVHVDVPDGLSGDAITAYLDERLDRIEPNGPALVAPVPNS